MRRILLVLAVGLVMVAMLMANAIPAFAKVNGDVDANGNCIAGTAETLGQITSGQGGSGGPGGGSGGNVTFDLTSSPGHPFSTFERSGGGGAQGGGGGGHCAGELSDPEACHGKGFTGQP